MNPIRNYDLMTQVIDFKSLRWGKKMPTNIDAFFEVQDKLYVIIEAKHKGHDVKGGQLIALERLCDALSENPKRIVLLVIAEHCIDREGDVDLGMLEVVKFRWESVWHTDNHFKNVRDLIEHYAEFCGISL